MRTFFRWNADDESFATVLGSTEEDRKATAPQHYGQTKLDVVNLDVVVDARGVLPIADCVNTGLSQPQLISDRARVVLDSFLSPNGRYVSASIVNTADRYWLWMPTTISDCLDEPQSVIYETFTGYRRVVEAVFDRARLPKEVVFLLKGFEGQSIWVCAEFKKRVEASGLLGFRFAHKAKLKEQGKESSLPS